MTANTNKGRLKLMNREFCKFDQATGFLFAGSGNKVVNPIALMAKM